TLPKRQIVALALLHLRRITVLAPPGWLTLARCPRKNVRMMFIAPRGLVLCLVMVVAIGCGQASPPVSQGAATPLNAAQSPVDLASTAADTAASSSALTTTAEAMTLAEAATSDIASAPDATTIATKESAPSSATPDGPQPREAAKPVVSEYG